MQLAFRIVAVVFFILSVFPPLDTYWNRLVSVGLAFLSASTLPL